MVYESRKERRRLILQKDGRVRGGFGTPLPCVLAQGTGPWKAFLARRMWWWVMLQGNEVACYEPRMSDAKDKFFLAALPLSFLKGSVKDTSPLFSFLKFYLNSTN